MRSKWKRNLSGSAGRLVRIFIMFADGIVLTLPVVTILTNSLMGEAELLQSYGSVLGGGEGELSWKLFPLYPTLHAYAELLLDSPGFFVMFWNSCKQVLPILAGQLFVGLPAAWAFGRYEFPGRRILFTLYMILMILPFQVTMTSTYLVLSKMNLIDTAYAVILPGIFSTFPVFIMTKFFRAIPRSMIEAAKVDGAGELHIFLHIGLPLGMPGILSAVLLSFLEYWNALEAPMTFLKTEEKYPLSLYLPNITADRMSVSFAASVVMMFPAFLIFLWGQEYLEQGIAASGLKE